MPPWLLWAPGRKLFHGDQGKIRSPVLRVDLILLSESTVPFHHEASNEVASCRLA